MLNLNDLKIEYITDESGEKKAVVLLIEQFQQLIEEIQTLTLLTKQKKIKQDDTLNLLNNKVKNSILQHSTGLCGIWEDVRSSDEIVTDIFSSRTQGRNFNYDLSA